MVSETLKIGVFFFHIKFFVKSVFDLVLVDDPTFDFFFFLFLFDDDVGGIDLLFV